MTAPTPGRHEVANLNLYADLAARVDASVARAAEQAEAMAKLRRVCAGEPAGDVPPPPSFVPLHPLYVPLGDTFRRQSSEARGGDPFVAIFLGGFFGTLAICYAIAHMLGWL